MNEQQAAPARERSPFSQPEMLVAMAAIVLSVCGLFIALYEASIARRAERASVWPHVEVSASVRGTRVEIWARNTGVGPARIRAANVSHRDTVVPDWAALMRALEVEVGETTRSFSLIGGRVLGVDAEPETIFAIDAKAESTDSDASRRLATAIFDGSVDVALCYCSVYDECWVARLQDIMRRRREAWTTSDEAMRADCATVSQSAI